MKKTVQKLTAVLLSVILGASSIATAGAAVTSKTASFPLKDAESTMTSVVFTDGSQAVYNGAADVSKLESWGGISTVASYTVSQNGEDVLSVELRDITADNGSVSASSASVMNGYYAADFDLPGTNREVFLTGLTPSNLASVQDKLIESYQRGTDMPLESIDFIDAEKTLASDNDDNLCWAASASNILYYTGWAQAAGFNTNDDVFDEFVDKFYDGGGQLPGGPSWFINGCYPHEVPEPDIGSAIIKNYGKSGNFLSDYSYETAIRRYDFSDQTCRPTENMKSLTEELRNGCGVMLGVKWMLSTGNFGGGHAISCWGFVLNNDYDENQGAHYEALFISDSDSDELNHSNRRAAPNKLNMINMVTLYSSYLGVDSWMFPNYFDSELIGVLSEFAAVIPFEQVQPEDSGSPATKDKFNSPDLTSPGFDMFAENCSFLTETFFKGQTIYVAPYVFNDGNVNYTGKLDCVLTVSDSSGKEVYSRTFSFDADIKPFETVEFENAAEGEFMSAAVKLEGLEPGKYTVKQKIISDSSIAEAYYNNNETSLDFTVSGDIDFSKIRLSAEPTGDYSSDEFSNPGAGIYRLTLESEGSGLDDCIEGYTTTGMRQYFSEYALWNEMGNAYEGGYPDIQYTVIDDEYDYYAEYNRYVNVNLSNMFEKNFSEVDFRVGLKLKGMRNPIYIHSDKITNDVPDVKCKRDFPDSETFFEHFAGEIPEVPEESRTFTFTTTATAEQGDFTGLIQVVNESDEKSLSVCTISDVRIRPGESYKIVIPVNDSLTAFDESEVSLEVSGAFENSGRMVSSNSSVFRFHIKDEEPNPVREEPGLVVTSVYDIENAYDGETSLIEALKYYVELGDPENVITFNLADGNEVFYDTVFEIDVPIKIDGKLPSGENVTLNGSMYPAERRFFTLGENADLKASNLTLFRGFINEGAAVYNKGGKAEFYNCEFLENEADTFGGAVLSDGGSVKLINCTAKNNNALYGGFALAKNGAQIDMLNCTICSNKSVGGIIYNAGADIKLVSCSVFCNESTLEGHGAIHSEGKAVNKLLNCVAVGNSNPDVSGNAELYACMVTNLAQGLEGVDVLEGIPLEDVIETDIDGNPEFIIVDSYEVPKVLEYASSGWKVSVDNGVLTYVDSSGEGSATDIPAVFEQEQYDVDSKNEPRKFACGSCEPVIVVYIYGDVNGDGEVTVADATEIQKSLVNLIGLTKLQTALADVDGDGDVSISDVTCIQKYTADLTDGIGSTGMIF